MRRIIRCAVRCVDYRVTAGIGAAALVTVISLDGVTTADLRTVSVVLLGSSLARWAVRPALQPLIEVYKAGRDSAYDEGYQAGRRVARPVVVALRAEDAG